MIGFTAQDWLLTGILLSILFTNLLLFIVVTELVRTRRMFEDDEEK